MPYSIPKFEFGMTHSWPDGSEWPESIWFADVCRRSCDKCTRSVGCTFEVGDFIDGTKIMRGHTASRADCFKLVVSRDNYG
eukprot:SAG11_NODE_37831_length_255_cov_0.660256_1_plen_80_part_01